jgi:hypothetical protein
MIMPMAHRGFTSRSKVSFLTYGVRNFIPEPRISIASPAYIRIFLHLTGEPRQYPWRASAKVQVPREQCLNNDGG